MTGQEMYEHIRQLASDLDVPVWICLGCEGEPYGEAVTVGSGVFVSLSHAPDEALPYLIALHELGHVWGGLKGLRLDREALAWDWAIAQSLLPLGPAEWCTVRDSLTSYLSDRRYTRTPAFSSLLADANRRCGAL